MVLCNLMIFTFQNWCIYVYICILVGGKLLCTYSEGIMHMQENIFVVNTDFLWSECSCCLEFEYECCHVFSVALDLFVKKKNFSCHLHCPYFNLQLSIDVNDFQLWKGKTYLFNYNMKTM